MLGIPPDIGLGDYASFSDESDLTSKFMIIGGFSCGTSFVKELGDILAEVQQQMPFQDRIEWKKITPKNVDSFIRLIDLVCLLNSEHLIDVHALVVDMHKFDHHTHNDGDHETSFDKMLFQNFYAAHKRYPGCSKIRCFHGNKDCRHPFENLLKMLNHKTSAPKARRSFRPYAQAQLADVKKSLHLQLADLIIGCIGAKWNHRKGYKEGSPKDIVASHFQRECPATSLGVKTPPFLRHFDVWEFNSPQA